MFVILLLIFLVFLFVKNSSEVKENLITVYGAFKELQDTISVLGYELIKYILYRISPKIYKNLAPLRNTFSISLIYSKLE